MVTGLSDFVTDAKTVLLGCDVRAEVLYLPSRRCRLRLFENIVALAGHRSLIGSPRLLLLDSFEFEALIVDLLESEVERGTLSLRPWRSSNFTGLVIPLPFLERRIQFVMIIADLD